MNTATKTSPVRRTLAGLAIGAFFVAGLAACSGPSTNYEGTYVNYNDEGDILTINADGTGHFITDQALRTPEFDLTWAIESFVPGESTLVIYRGDDEADGDAYDTSADVTEFDGEQLYLQENPSTGSIIENDYYVKQ